MFTILGSRVLAEKDRQDKLDLIKGLYTGEGIGGALLAANSFTSGDLTGRDTVYHGTSPKNADSIRQEGLKPATRENANHTKILEYDPE